MRHRVALLAGLAAFAPALLAAQQPRTVTAADYARAEKSMGVLHVRPGQRRIREPELDVRRPLLVSRVHAAGRASSCSSIPRAARRGRRSITPRLAGTLSTVTGQSYTAATLPFFSIDLSEDGRTVSFDAAGRHYRCDVGGTACTDEGAASGRRRVRARRPWVRTRRRAGGGAANGRAPENMSPDGQHARIHPRLESLGARRGHRPGDAAHARRRGELRLRHRQRRVEAQRPGDRASGRPTPGRSPPTSRISATIGDMYLVEHQRRAPDAPGVEVSAARRQRSSR